MATLSIKPFLSVRARKRAEVPADCDPRDAIINHRERLQGDSLHEAVILLY
jgi:hypothetical protein